MSHVATCYKKPEWTLQVSIVHPWLMIFQFFIIIHNHSPLFTLDHHYSPSFSMIQHYSQLVGGLEHFLFFHSVGNFIIVKLRTHIFQRGRSTTSMAKALFTIIHHYSHLITMIFHDSSFFTQTLPHYYIILYGYIMVYNVTQFHHDFESIRVLLMRSAVAMARRYFASMSSPAVMKFCKGPGAKAAPKRLRGDGGTLLTEDGGEAKWGCFVNPRDLWILS